MKPPDEFELSLPRLCLPLVSGVDVPGGDIDRFGLGPGEDMPGDLESGGAYRCDGFEEKGRELVAVVFEADWIVCVVSAALFVVMVFELDVALAVVVETCAVETSDVGDIAEVGFDFAWYVGLDLALKAEKKLVKKGLFVGILVGYE
jgi:hypothetical protein